MQFKRDYNVQSLMYTPRDRLIVVNCKKKGGGNNDDLLLNHDLHSNIIKTKQIHINMMKKNNEQANSKKKIQV
jgi:hypothetical protein